MCVLGCSAVVGALSLVLVDDSSLWFYLCPLEVHGVHERALKVLDPGVLALQQPLELEVGLRSASEQRQCAKPALGQGTGTGTGTGQTAMAIHVLSALPRTILH